MNENENDEGIEKGTRALSRSKDSLIGQEMTLIQIEPKETKIPENETREVNPIFALF